MKSEADVIYNHIVRSKSDEVVSIEIDHDINFINAITQYICKTKRNVFKEVIEAEVMAKRLYPYFTIETDKWSKKVGLHINLWSEAEHERFREYFMDKYKGMMK